MQALLDNAMVLEYNSKGGTRRGLEAIISSLEHASPS